MQNITSSPSSFRLSVPQPCSEAWESMQADEKGRFCANCQKTVIDFTQFSDKEIREFLMSAKTKTCGRFHLSQLDRPLVPPVAKREKLPRVYKRMLALLAFLNLKQTAVFSQDQSPIKNQQSYNGSRYTDSIHRNKISGNIKTPDGKFLENVVITVNGKQVAVSDKEGKYAFEIDQQLQTAVLNFSYPEKVTVARSYHSAMGSTSYDIVLDKPLRMLSPRIIMGIINHSFHLPDSLSSLQFKKENTNIGSAMTIKLAELAAVLRNNPTDKVILIGYASKNADIKMVTKRQKAITLHLIEKEGISEDRISSRLDKDGSSSSNTIDINLE